MPQMPENHGLSFIYDSDEHFNNFVAYALSNGKQLDTYSSGPYLFVKMGTSEVWLSTKVEETGNLSPTSIHTHSCGKSWDNCMVCTDIELSENNEDIPDRLLVFNRTEDNSGLLPIHVITPDVLPSLMKDDITSIQVVALPTDIEYFKNPDELESFHSKNNTPDPITAVADGTLYPLWLLSNSDPKSPEDTIDHSMDDLVLFRGKVKGLYEGCIHAGEEKIPAFIKCVIETPYGDLEIDHSYNLVPKKMRKNIKVGATVCGICILSGDVALYDYKDGFVKDHENDLLALRFSIVNGKAQRLRKILADNVQYSSDRNGESYCGAESVIECLNHAHENCGENRYHAYLATIMSTDEVENPEYSVGTRCLVIAQGHEKNYSALAFLECDESGIITRITESNKKYRFKLENDDNSINDISGFLKQRDLTAAHSSNDTDSFMITYKDMDGDKWLGVIMRKYDKEGRVCKVYLGNASGQRVNLSAQDKYEEYPEIHEPPEGKRISLSGILIEQAKYHELIDSDTDAEALTSSYYLEALSNTRMREDIEELLSPRPDTSVKDTDTCLGNLFGYILAKAVEEEILQLIKNRHPEGEYDEHVSYSASDAYSGRFCSILFRLMDDIALNDVIRFGASFYGIFKKFCTLSGTETDTMLRLLSQALMVMNYIGKLYAPKFIYQNNIRI